MTDLHGQTRSRSMLREGFLLTKNVVDWFNLNVLGGGVARANAEIISAPRAHLARV